MIRLCLTIILLLTGCNSIELDSKWYPLIKVVERPGSGTAITTIGNKVYLTELDNFLERYPVDSPRFEEIMSHEKVHSVRQLDYGLYGWLFKYLINQEFRKYEEQLGWYVSIKMYQKFGLVVNVDQLIDILINYDLKLFDSEKEVRDWITQVLNNDWKPEPGTLGIPDGL